ncbi:MAG: AI-2E family transporter [Patescibacteria group bacterium]
MDKNTLSINITFGSMFKLVVAGLAAFLAFKLRGLILVLLISIVTASVIEPGTRWFVRRKVPRMLAVILMYVIIALIVVGTISFVLPPLFVQTIEAINGLPKYIKTIDILAPFHDQWFTGVETLFPGLPKVISVGDLAGEITRAISNFSGGIFDTVSNFFGGVISFILVIVLSFYLSVREDGVGEFLGIITPIEYEPYVRGLWRRSQNKIGRWMQGQILLGLLVGVLTYIGLSILGVPHPFLLAFVAAVFELIPVVGLIISVIPAFFLAFLDGGLGLGLLVLAIYLFIQQIEAHLIYPLVVNKIIGVPPLLVIIALVAGAELAGLVGALLAVPISVALMEYLDDFEKRKRIGQQKSVIG